MTPVNKSGEVNRTDFLAVRKKADREISPEDQLFFYYDSLGSHSNLPTGVELPEDDLWYWKQPRLEHNVGIFKKMQSLAQAHGINEITNTNTGDSIILADFFDKIERSIAFSQKINAEERKEEQHDLTDKQRKKLQHLMR